MADTRSGEWVLARLAERGVKYLFGIPGIHTLALYAGLPGSGIEHVTARHEQATGFMADAYARVSGYPGVCCVISGPGLTNIATAMAQAYADSVPMLVLSSVSARRHLGRGLGQLHELRDQRAVATGVSAFSHTLQCLDDLPTVLDRAFNLFATARPRPVHIEIPLDVWRQPLPPAVSSPALGAALCQPASDHLDAAVRALDASLRPVILAGGGARRAAGPLRDLAERLDAPVVMTVNGRGLLDPEHPLAVSASPSLDPVRGLLAQADVCLAVGTEIGPTDYDVYERGMPVLGATLIRLDNDPAQMTQPRVADVPLLGDAGLTLASLIIPLRARARAEAGAERARRVREAARASLEPRWRQAVVFLETIRNTLPSAIVVGDSTQPVYAGNLDFAAARPASWFNSATGYGTLGYALPAALGAALAAPDRPVVCLVGDGGLHFSLGELASIRDHRRPVIVVVWNNEGYGEIRRAMQDAGMTPVGVDLYTPDFEALAVAYGFAFQAPASLVELRGALRAAAACTDPTLLCVDERHFLVDQ